jgi:hypothetical protein
LNYRIGLSVVEIVRMVRSVLTGSPPQCASTVVITGGAPLPAFHRRSGGEIAKLVWVVAVAYATVVVETARFRRPQILRAADNISCRGCGGSEKMYCAIFCTNGFLY